MEPMDQSLQPSESLQLIISVIAKTKDNIKEHTFCFLVWGWLIAGASLSFFFLHQFTDFRGYFLPFPLAVVTGITITVLHYRGKSLAAQTYMGYYLGKLWLALGIGFIVVVLINIWEHNPPFTYTLLIAGIGTLVTGMVTRFRPLVAGGILFLLLALFSVFVADGYKPLLQAFAVLGGYLVPGYMLKYSKS